MLSTLLALLPLPSLFLPQFTHTVLMSSFLTLLFFFLILLLFLCLYASTKEMCPSIGSLSNATQHKQRKKTKIDSNIIFFQGSRWPAVKKHSLCTCGILSSRSLKDILQQKQNKTKSFAPNLFWAISLSFAQQTLNIIDDPMVKMHCME